MMTIRWRSFAAALSFFLMFASLVARGQEYKIKLRHTAQIGESYPYSAETSTERNIISTVPGQPPTTKNDKTTAQLSGTLKVLDVDEKGNANEVSMTISKCMVDGQPLYPSGTVLDAKRVRPGPAAYTKNGFPIMETDAGVMELLLPLVDLTKTDEDGLFGSATPRKVGDSWPLDFGTASGIFKELGMTGKKEDLSGSTKLARVDQTDGKESLHILGNCAVKNMTGMNGPAEGMTVRSGDVTIDFAGDISADDSTPPPLISRVTTVHMTVDSPGENGSPTLVEATVKRSEKIITGSQAIPSAEK